jgi:stage II sporulation protein D
LTFYLDPIYKIPLNELRDEFKLKSTFFSAEIIDENILLQGRGFGHGVGLCQEGAMNMSKLGYKHEQILNHYFNGMYLNKY